MGEYFELVTGRRRAISSSVRRGGVALVNFSGYASLSGVLKYFQLTRGVWKTQTFQWKSVIFEGKLMHVHTLEIHLLALSEF